jgi:hypothetical protein
MPLRKLSQQDVEDIKRQMEAPEVEALRQKVEALEGALGRVSIENAVTMEDGWLHEAVISQYGNYARATQKFAIAFDMMVKNTVNKAVIHGRGIMGAGKLVNRRAPTPLVQQVAFVLIGIIVLALAGSVVTHSGVSEWLLAAPYGIPDWLALAGIFIIVILLLRSRSNR